MNKLISVFIVTILFLVVLSVVGLFLTILAYVASPLDIKKRYIKQPSDLSVLLHNQSTLPVLLNTIELGPDASIELRSLSKRLFISWHGNVKISGQELVPSSQLKLENSIYGKYSIPIDQTLWKSLIYAPIAETTCRGHIFFFTWFTSLPSRSLILSIREQEKGAFLQTSYYKAASPDLFDVEMKEIYRRYPSRGSNFVDRYHCQTTGKTDRLGQFVRLIENLFHPDGVHIPHLSSVFTGKAEPWGLDFKAPSMR